MQVKLKDIAERTGVSITTVSMILNNKPFRISERTRKSVLQAAKEMGYIRRQKIHSIGLLVPDLSNLYYSEIAHNISLYAQENEHNVLIFDSNNNAEREISSLLTLRETDIDGIIMGLVAEDENLSQIRPIIEDISQNSQIPIVLIDRSCQLLNCHSISINNYYGGYLAAKHLLDLGHKKIGCITGNIALRESQERANGYKAAFSESGLPFKESWIANGTFSEESGYNLTQKLLDQGVTAIFAQNDMIALGVYHYLREKRIRIPDEVSLVGFDNIPSVSILDVPLTTVAQPIKAMGRRAIDILLPEKFDYETSDKISLTLMPELIVRESSSKCPANHRQTK